jgi:hypothetical protein
VTAEAQLTPSSRRAVLAAGLGGLVALVAQALGRPSAVRAANNDPVTAGNVVSASATTGVDTSAGNGLQGRTSAATSGVYGESNGTGANTGTGVAGYSGQGVGVFGQTGNSVAAPTGSIAVWGKAPGSTGVWGEGYFSGTGVLATGGVGLKAAAESSGLGSKAVWAVGQSGMGVDADTQAEVPAIRGTANGNSTGVQGYSGPGAAPAAIAKTGVFGYANQDANAQGVLGRSALGNGVVGDSASGFGVKGLSGTSAGGYFNSTSGDALVGQILDANSTRTAILGLATKGAGVSGTATTGRAISGTASAAGGIGVRAQAPTTGYALDVSGRSRFSRSGKLAIAAGRSYITKTGVPLTSKSLVLAVLQTNRSGIYVRAVVPNVTGASFTIYLNTRVPGTTYVAWFVIEAP